MFLFRCLHGRQCEWLKDESHILSKWWTSDDFRICRKKRRNTQGTRVHLTICNLSTSEKQPKEIGRERGSEKRKKITHCVWVCERLFMRYVFFSTNESVQHHLSKHSTYLKQVNHRQFLGYFIRLLNGFSLHLTVLIENETILSSILISIRQLYTSKLYHFINNSLQSDRLLRNDKFKSFQFRKRKTVRRNDTHKCTSNELPFRINSHTHNRLLNIKQAAVSENIERATEIYFRIVCQRWRHQQNKPRFLPTKPSSSHFKPSHFPKM